MAILAPEMTYMPNNQGTLTAKQFSLQGSPDLYEPDYYALMASLVVLEVVDVGNNIGSLALSAQILTHTNN